MAGGEQEARPPIGDLIERVVDDARRLAKAEIAVARAIALWRLSGLKVGVPLLLGSLFLAQGVVAALLVGLVLLLAPLMGAGWATLLVITIASVLAGLLAWVGLRRCATLVSPLPADGE